LFVKQRVKARTPKDKQGRNIIYEKKGVVGRDFPLDKTPLGERSGLREKKG